MDNYMEKLLESVKRTGFSLENTVTSRLEQLGWTVISNRYYLDDLTSAPREIDQIAYKSELRADVRFFYVLIISCKKSEAEDWVLFTRDMNSSGLNLERFPTLLWTNEKILERKLSEPAFSKKFEESVLRSKNLRAIHDVEKVVFAFQQFDRKSATARNDTDIYNSITSTVKAAEYEMRSLPNRKSESCCYFFNLVSLFHGRIYEAYHGDKVELSEIHSATYTNRLIVNGKDRHYKVNFIDLGYLDQFLQLHEDSRQEIVDLLSGLRNNFYVEILENSAYLNLFLKETKAHLDSSIAYVLDSEGYSTIEIASLYYFEKGNILHIEVNTSDQEVLGKLNSNEKLEVRTRKFLKDRYRYEGNFEFVSSWFF